MEDGGGNASYGKGLLSSHPWNYWEQGARSSSAADWSSSFLPPSFDGDDATNLTTKVYGGGGGENVHLTCLNLGKRHYFEDGGEAALGGKRGRGAGYYHPSSSAAAVVPRCQVEGCHVALTEAKDYHRRHKVCEAHSKAPKVVVLGVEQRFCQQCSRCEMNSQERFRELGILLSALFLFL